MLAARVCIRPAREHAQPAQACPERAGMSVRSVAGGCSVAPTTPQLSALVRQRWCKRELSNLWPVLALRMLVSPSPTRTRCGSAPLLGGWWYVWPALASVLLCWLCWARRVRRRPCDADVRAGAHVHAQLCVRCRGLGGAAAAYRAYAASVLFSIKCRESTPCSA